MRTVLKYIYYAAVIVGSIFMLVAMFIDATNQNLAETLAKIGLYAVISGIVMYLALIIGEKFRRK